MTWAEKCAELIESVDEGHLTVTAAAGEAGCSRQWFTTLRRRYHQEGPAGLQPRSRRPKNSPRRTPDEMVELIWQSHDYLEAGGYYSGARTVHWHMEEEGLNPPSIATVHRILKAERPE
ncbi:MAG: helix-turn-helix domain-containing protein [Corynebacterium sp.]|nr:helix-turn-helix domain-containing protein [Corynebacterium sp.]